MHLISVRKLLAQFCGTTIDNQQCIFNIQIDIQLVDQAG